jgi:hypothetical protein
MTIQIYTNVYQSVSKSIVKLHDTDIFSVQFISLKASKIIQKILKIHFFFI